MQLACANICHPTLTLYGFSRRALVYRVQGVDAYQARVYRRTCLTRASLSRTEDGLDSELVGHQHKTPSFQERTADAVKVYPWGKLCGRFLQRVVDLAWIPTKWLAIPVFALSIISEFVYTLSIKREIFIPLGILSGVLLAKVLGNASLDAMKELHQDDARASWPLMLLGLFFLLLKLPGPSYPGWAAAFVPHMANAGLVTTALLFKGSHGLSTEYR